MKPLPTMLASRNKGLHERQFMALLSAVVALTGMLILIGWMLGIRCLTTLIPGSISVKANTGIAFMLTGASFLFSCVPGKIAPFIGRLFSLIAGMIGLLTLVEFFGKVPLGIDELLFRDVFLNNATPWPGQMAGSTALCFVLAAAAQWLSGTSRFKGYQPACLMFLGTMMLVLVVNSVVSYLAGFFLDSIWGRFSSMAVATEILFILLAARIFFLVWIEQGESWMINPSLAISAFSLMILVSFTTTLSCRTMISFVNASALVKKTDEVIGTLHHLRATLDEDQSGLRGYLITGSPDFLPLSVRASTMETDIMTSLRRQFLAMPVLPGEMKDLEKTLHQWIGFRNAVMETCGADGFQKGREMIATKHGKVIMDGIREILDRLVSVELRRKESREIEAGRIIKWMLLFLPASMVIIMLAIIAGFFRLNDEIRIRQRTAESLARNSKRFRMALEAGRIGEWQLDLVRHTSERSLIHDQIFGYEAMLPEWSFEIFLGHVHPEDRERVKKTFEQSLGTGEDWTFECRIIRKDGSPGWVWARGAVMTDDAGTPVELIGLIGDITERRFAEASLAHKESFQRAILDSAVTAIVATDLDGTVTLYNPEAERIFGYSASEIVRKKTPALWHDPKEVAERAGTLSEELGIPVVPGFEVFTTMALHGKRDAGEWSFVRKDGTIVPGLLSVSTLRDQKGVVTGYLGIMRDITRLKKSEEALRLSEVRVRLATEAGQIAVWDWIMSDGSLLLDPIFCEIYGIPHHEGYTFNIEEWKLWVHPDDLSEQLRLLGQMAETRNPDLSLRQFRIIRQNDHAVRTIRASTAAITGKDGKTVRLVGTNMDITDNLEQIAWINTLNDQLAQRALELESSVKELDAFSYSVSHDLRAPLRAIDGFSQIMEEDYAAKLDDEGRHVIDVIRSETQRMGRLIDDLLAFSRLGRQKIEPTMIDMGRMARNVFEELSSQETGRKILLDLHPLPSALGTEPMIRQVWVNLISNAIKFTKHRDPAEIVIDSSSGIHGETIYFVKDNGAGFDMRHADKLFGVFQRLHSAEEFPGTGVGLSLVQRIIQRHGGAVRGEGEVNKGATFSFSLPRDEPFRETSGKIFQIPLPTNRKTKTKTTS